MGTEEGGGSICEASYATPRMVDFIEESRHKVLEDMDRAFHDRMKLAKEGTLARSCLGIFLTQASDHRYAWPRIG